MQNIMYEYCNNLRIHVSAFAFSVHIKTSSGSSTMDHLTNGKPEWGKAV